MSFRGIITALATPFYQGEVDLPSFTRLIKNQLDEGVNGFVIAGTTGESPCLSQKEISLLMETAHAQVSDQVPLILGIGHNNTRQAVQNLEIAQKLKAQAVLAVVPYYNKPSQEGLYRHFKSLAEHSKLPILLYNVPGRCQVSLSAETIFRLSKESSIVGIKEASADMDFGKQLIQKLPKDFIISSGDDSTFLQLVESGGHGVISVSSHFMLGPMKTFFKRVLNKDPSAVEEFQQKYGAVIQSLFKVSNPMMIKQVLHLKGWIRSPELRLPLCEPSEEQRLEIKKLLQEKGEL